MRWAEGLSFPWSNWQTRCASPPIGRCFTQLLMAKAFFAWARSPKYERFSAKQWHEVTARGFRYGANNRRIWVTVMLSPTVVRKEHVVMKLDSRKAPTPILARIGTRNRSGVGRACLSAPPLASVLRRAEDRPALPVGMDESSKFNDLN